MPDAPIDTSFLDRAITFAVEAHAGTERRGKGFPYIVHPMEAMAIVSSMTSDQELLAAAALHDTVEDTGVTVEELRERFGDRVADLVAAESDQTDPGLDWHTRKKAALDKLCAAERDVKVVALGDKLSNMRAIARDYAEKGDALWGLFHASDPSEHAWRYHALADALRELEDTAAFKEFEYLIEKVFGK